MMWPLKTPRFGAGMQTEALHFDPCAFAFPYGGRGCGQGEEHGRVQPGPAPGFAGCRGMLRSSWRPVSRVWRETSAGVVFPEPGCLWTARWKAQLLPSRACLEALGEDEAWCKVLCIFPL